MAKVKISQYDATAGNNTDIDSISIAEGMLPSNVNNALRELMAHLKDMDAGTQALTSPQLTSVDINGGTIDGAVIGGSSAAAISGTTLALSGNADLNGALDVATTALVTGVLTTTAATVSNGGGQFNGAINVGVDGTGYDVKFFGDTASAYMLWDQSADDLILGGAARLIIGDTDPNARLLRVKGTGDLVEFTSTNAGAGGAQLDLKHESASPANDDIVGIINFNGLDAGANNTQYANIQGVATDISNEIGELRFGTRTSSSSFTAKMVIDGNGKVGIGVTGNDIDQKLHVYESSGSSSAYLQIENNRARNAAVLTKTTAGGFYAGTSIGTDTLCWQVYDVASGERLRLDASGNLKINSGNLVIATAGKGIDFAATSDGSGTDTSELFDDYEEGTLLKTPTWTSSSATFSYTAQYGNYVKVGSMVHAQFYLLANASGTTSNGLGLTGFPYTSANLTAFNQWAGNAWFQSDTSITPLMGNNVASAALYKNKSGTPATLLASDIHNRYWVGSISYRAT